VAGCWIRIQRRAHGNLLSVRRVLLVQTPALLETIQSGRTVGKIGFILGMRRTASVMANLDSVVYSLFMEDLVHMDVRDPEAANIFHRLSVILLSQRVIHLTSSVRALERS
jgi:hypothetical protein